LKKLAIELDCACRATDDARSPLSAFAEETVKPTLGQYLASIRHDRKMSLRQVEEASSKEVSNAYLSQLETGKIVQPSPNVLNTLSEIYEIDYVQLMELAGYLSPSAAREATQRHGRLATFAEHNLTPEEEGALMKYLKFLRMDQPP
jgi:transcriptional regulator with XRE-family HTH domain